MSDLRAIGGGKQTTADPASNGHVPADDFERRQQARAKPMAALDDDGKILRKLAVPNKLMGLAKGTRLVRVLQRGEGDRAQYDLELENGGRIVLSDSGLADPRAVERAVRRVAKRPMEWLSLKEWKVGADAIALAAVPDNATDSEQDETAEWLASFVSDAVTHTLLAHAPGSAVPLDDQAKLFDVLKSDDGAFRGSDDRLYVRPPQLLQHVTAILRQRTTSTELRQRLGRLGFTKPRNSQGQLAARKGEETITHRYLASPPGWELP